MPLYGAAQGVQAALGDAQRLSQLALFPEEAQLAKAQAGLATETLREKQAERSALQEFSHPQPGQPGAAPTSMSDQLSRLATLEFEKGAPTAGMAMLKQADLMRMHESTIEKNQSTIQLNSLKQDQAEAAWAAQRLATIDPKSPSASAQWARVNLDYMTMFGKPSPFATTPYSPQLLDRVLHSSISAKDQLTLKLRAQEQSERVRHDASMEGAANARVAAMKAKNKAYTEHLKFLEKNGGKTVTANTSDVRAASQLIKQNFPGADLTNPDVYGAAVDVANRARTLMQQNRALTYRQAQVRAMEDVSKEQAWQTHTSWGAPGPLQITTGETPQTAMPLPADRGKLETGKWYSTSKGVGKWDGKNFESE
ncbi:MAG: hypothetical protein ACYDB1_00790 [Acidiferrobacteraceae bacterium]